MNFFRTVFFRSGMIALLCIAAPFAFARERVEVLPGTPSIETGWVEHVETCTLEDGSHVRDQLWSKHDDDFRLHSSLFVDGVLVRVMHQTTINVVAATNTTIYVSDMRGAWTRYDSSLGELDHARTDLAAILGARGIARDLFDGCRYIR